MQPFGPGVNLDKNCLKLHLDLCTNEISLKTWWGRNFVHIAFKIKGIDNRSILIMKHTQHLF